MTITTRKPTTIVPANKVTKLGKAGGFEYSEVDGTEHILEPAVLLEPGDVAEKPGQKFVSIPQMLVDEQTGRAHQMGNKYRRAMPVKAGTFERESARTGTSKPAPTPTRPVDALALPALSAKASMIVPGPPRPTSLVIGLEATVPNPNGAGGFVPGRGPVRGRAILDLLEARGITLQVHAGKLLVTAPKGRMTGDLRTVVDKATPLLIGYLGGTPFPCEVHPPADKGTPSDDPPEAWTILLGGLAACEACATGSTE